MVRVNHSEDYVQGGKETNNFSMNNLIQVKLYTGASPKRNWGGGNVMINNADSQNNNDKMENMRIV